MSHGKALKRNGKSWNGVLLQRLVGKRQTQENYASKRCPSLLFDIQGIIHKEFLPQETTINAARNIEISTRFTKRRCRKTPSGQTVRIFHLVSQKSAGLYSAPFSPTDFFHVECWRAFVEKIVKTRISESVSSFALSSFDPKVRRYGVQVPNLEILKYHYKAMFKIIHLGVNALLELSGEAMLEVIIRKCGVEINSRSVRAQVSSCSLDRGSKLQRPVTNSLRVVL
ncbi:hypothetical protein TNCV_4466121 [Trichonephila clavipes]|nr:hypothetical protein TNCV_4466121 [Trichonephila clavipes]